MVVDWVADFVEWADLIGLPPCPVVEWSIGGQFALALSARCPARVTSVGVAAGHAPLDELHDGWNSLSDETRAYVESLRRDPIVPRADTDCLADGIAGSTLTILPGEGHLFPVTHWRQMLAALA